MATCLICANPVDSFLSFGKMPIANGFLRREDFAHEFFFELKVGYCTHCHMVQLTELVDPSQLFHENYAYFSSISVRMANHFKAFAEMVRETYLTESNPLVVEIGSNDGIMLQNFMRAGIDHLGVEPSANVARAAQEKGVRTINRFFNEETAHDIRREYGPADALLGANVICHLPDMHTLVRGVQVLLKERGVFIFEEPYLGDIVTKTSYDQIYDEHVFYFSLHSLGYLFNQYDMEIIDIMPQTVHGGSMRYVVARRGARPVSAAVQEQLAHEVELGLTRAETYLELRDRIYRSKEELVAILTNLKQQGKRVAGYGATSKSTTVLNFCGIGPDLIEYISDTTPGKQGKYSPGMHIPVVPYAHFQAEAPDHALLFAWNHGEEIIAKEQEFRRNGGKFLVYVPKVQILD